MKTNGQDLVTQLVAETMPDVQQVRDNIHTNTFTTAPKRLTRKLRWAVVGALAACFVVTSAVAAVIRSVRQAWNVRAPNHQAATDRLRGACSQCRMSGLK